MADGVDITRHGVWVTDVETKAARQYDVWRRTGDDTGHEAVDDVAAKTAETIPEPRKTVESRKLEC
jgi:hypothetical protein